MVKIKILYGERISKLIEDCNLYHEGNRMFCWINHVFNKPIHLTNYEITSLKRMWWMDS